MKQIGFIFKFIKFYAILIIPYHIFHKKYKKLQVKIKKYYIFNYRQEYKKGDIILFNTKTNKVYKIIH